MLLNMEKSKRSLLQNPRSLLKFRGPFSSQASTILKLINSSRTRVAFRITAPTPKHISIIPEYGAVDAHHLTEIAVCIQPCVREYLGFGKHVLHVESMFAPISDRDPKQQLLEASSDDLMVSELECVFENVDTESPASIASAKRDKIINYAVIESESEDTDSKTSCVRTNDDEVECARFDFETQEYDINSALKHSAKRTNSEAQTTITWKVVKCARCGKKENRVTRSLREKTGQTNNTETGENSIIFVAKDNTDCLNLDTDDDICGCKDVASGKHKKFDPIVKDVASGMSKNIIDSSFDADSDGEAGVLTQELQDIKQDIIALQKICGNLRDPPLKPQGKEYNTYSATFIILSIGAVLLGLILGTFTFGTLGFHTHAWTKSTIVKSVENQNPII